LLRPALGAGGTSPKGFDLSNIWAKSQNIWAKKLRKFSKISINLCPLVCPRFWFVSEIHQKRQKDVLIMVFQGLAQFFQIQV